MPLPTLGPLSSEEVAGILSEYGFTANPAGLITHYPADLTFERESLAYLDINAMAVRRGNIVPERPIRITFRCETDGVSSQWRLLSVLELARGVPSKALDREPNFPKVSPWPNGGEK